MPANCGDTIWVKATITDRHGTRFDPDSQIITLHDPGGAIQDTDIAPTQLSTGVFESKLQIPAGCMSGLWETKWETTAGGEKETEKYRLVVHT